MNRRDIIDRHRARVFVYTILLLLALIAILLVCGWIVGGGQTVIAVGLALGVIFTTALRMPARTIMYFHRALPLPCQELPSIQHAVLTMARRAGLPIPPRLYIMPSPAANALSTGSKEDSAIAVSSGALNLLNEREMIAVLAHEMAHIAHGDIRLTVASELLRQAVSTIAMAGVAFALVITVMAPEAAVPGWVLLLLVAAPILAFLCQRGISRQREFAADMSAVELNDDPEGLASALIKIDRHSQTLFMRLFRVRRERDLPRLLQTHPETGERIAQLMRLAAGPGHGFPGPRA